MILVREADQAVLMCVCGHRWRVHSKLDEQCLGGTVERPMSCRCEEFRKEGGDGDEAQG